MNIFWITDRNSLQVRIRVVESPLAVIPIILAVWTEEFTKLFVILEVSRTLEKEEN